MSSTGRFEDWLAPSVAPELDISRAIPTESLGKGSSLPQVEELSPGLDPAEAFENLAGLPHLLFLDSALRHPHLGRYSYLTGDPFEWIWSRGRHTYISNEPEPPQDRPHTGLPTASG